MGTNIEVVIDEKIKTITKEPNQYSVIFLNDDATPMDFVISVLVELYKHSEETARSLTIQIHEEGSGVVGTYSYEIAEQKAIETTTLCRENGFPLRVRVEEEL
jgi:ATP-dependent Clp protease adaptor protein ClpS